MLVVFLDQIRKLVNQRLKMLIFFFFFSPIKSLVEKVEMIETEIQMEKKTKHLSGHLSLSGGLLT